MAAEVSLKEESALEIGKQLAFSYQGLKAAGADTANGGLELEEEKQQTSYLETISGGIKKMVMFFGGIAAATKEARRDRLITEAQGTEAEKEALADDPERSLGIGDMFKGLGEKTKSFVAPITGIFGGLFGKAALFGLLLTFALNMDKFSGQIKEFVGPIFEGLKSAFKSLKEDIFPVIENILKFFGEAFTAVQNILKGLFEGDGSAFLSGIKAIFLDLPIRLVSIIGDAFFSLVDAVLNFFGIESQMVQDIKIAFRTLPEAIKNAVQAFVDFFTVDIPNKFNEIKTNVKNAIGDFVNKVVDTITGVVDSVKEMFLSPFKAIKNKVASFFGFSVDTATDGDPVETAKATAIEKSVKEPIIAGDKNVPEPVEPIAKVGKIKVNTLEELINARDKLLIDGPKNDSPLAKNTHKFFIKKLNAAIIREEGRGEDHLKANRLNPLEYGLEDSTGNIESYVADKTGNITGSDTNELPQSNTPMIKPEDIESGGQLNKDSQEFASMPPSVSMNVIKGGDNTNVSSNQTHTNISESTTTSDTNAKKIFKTA